MPITFSCPCGKSYTVADNLAGKRTHCPACRAALTVPEPVFELSAADVIEEVDGGDVVEDCEVVETEVKVVEEAAEPAKAPGAKTVERPKYFLAAFEGVVSTAKLFRVYVDGASLLFIHAGPFHRSMVKTVPENQARMVQSATMIGAQHGAEGAELGAAAAGLALGIDWVVGKKVARDVAKRAEALDPMTIEQLRAEAESDKSSFRVTPDNTSDVSIDEPANNLWKGDESKLGIEARLRFTHQPTGKWNLQLFRREDVKAAVRYFRRVLGKENVEVLL